MAYIINKEALTEAIKSAVRENFAPMQQQRSNDLHDVFVNLEDACPVKDLVAVAKQYESYYMAAVAAMENAHKYIMSNQQLQIANVAPKYGDTIVYTFASPIPYNEETDSYGNVDIDSFLDDVVAEARVPQNPYERGRYLVNLSPEYGRGSDDIFGISMELNMPSFKNICEEYGIDMPY